MLPAVPRHDLSWIVQDQSVASIVQERLLEEQIRPIIQPQLTRRPSHAAHYDYGLVLRYTGLWSQDHGPDIVPPFVAGGEFQGFRTAH